MQPRQTKQHFPTNRQVFGRPRAPTNVFSPKNSNKPTTLPEPMDTSSGSKSNPFISMNPMNFRTEELHNNELSEQYLEQDPEYQLLYPEPYYHESYYPETYYSGPEQLDEQTTDEVNQQNFQEAHHENQIG